MNEPQPNVVDVDEHRSAEKAAKDLVPDLSEDRVALEFVDRNVDVVRFDHNRKRWHIWNGNRWKPDTTAAAFAWTRSLVRAMGSDQKSAGDRRLGSHKFADG